MPTQQELELLNLLTQVRASNGRPEQRRRLPDPGSMSQKSAQSSQLPDLEPGMLLSASAAREVTAAQQLFGGPTLGPMVPPGNHKDVDAGMYESLVKGLQVPTAEAPTAEKIAANILANTVKTVQVKQTRFAAVIPKAASVSDTRGMAQEMFMMNASEEFDRQVMEQLMVADQQPSGAPLPGVTEMEQLESLWSTEPTDPEDPVAPMSRSASSAAARNAPPPVDAALASLWESTIPEGARELAGASAFQTEYAGQFHQPVADAGAYDIQFDTDDMLPGRTTPNEAVRFQVGRQSPPTRPLNRRAQAVDGQVVSVRQPGGGFRRVSTEERRFRTPAVAPPASFYEPKSPGTIKRSQPLPPPPPAPPAKSALERVASGSWLDD